MEIKYLYNPLTLYIKEKYNNQTYYMEFSCFSDDYHIYYWNVFLSVYSKRKKINKELESHTLTGRNPFYTISFAVRAFKELEQEIRTVYGKRDNVICIYWTDNKRREAYYKILSKYGFDYKTLGNKKCLMKKIKGVKNE